MKVHATTDTAGDIRMRSLKVPPLFWLPARITLGFTKLKHSIYGMELAGVVEAAGKEVTLFKVGDPVFASTLAMNFGAHTEYKCLPDDGLVFNKPQNMTYEEAAVVPIGALTALRLLCKGKIQRGQKVLIYGASGSVGTYAVQIAKSYEAEVTGVCSTTHLELVRSLGVDRVIHCAKEDFSASDVLYDMIVDMVGKCPKTQFTKALVRNGIFVTIARLDTKQSLEEFTTIKGLIEAGKIRAVIDRCYPLEQIVEAHRYVDTWHKTGNVVIQVR